MALDRINTFKNATVAKASLRSGPRPALASRKDLQVGGCGLHLAEAG